MTPLTPEFLARCPVERGLVPADPRPAAFGAARTFRLINWDNPSLTLSSNMVFLALDI